jgi:hypothetical protein
MSQVYLWCVREGTAESLGTDSVLDSEKWIEREKVCDGIGFDGNPRIRSVW